MKQSICEAAQSGRPIIAECGGFMYVCNHLVETDDSLEEMLGLINTDVRMKIKIHKTAICGTDVHIYQWNDWAQHTIPIGLTAGHEYV